MRKRTAKTLGMRHDLNYFKYFTAFRFWRLLLALLVPALAVLWLGVSTQKKKTIYSKGPLSSGHAFFADQCSLCHSPLVLGMRMVGFNRTVTDEVCLSCHQAPAHQAGQLFTPTCASCHVEHQGLVRLSHVQDAQCVQCHSDLKTRVGHPRFVSDIRGFNRNHPEFAPLREPSAAAITITFSHATHMGEIMRSPSGRVKMECDDCHRLATEIAGAWKYAERLQPVMAPADSGETPRLGVGHDLMAPVSYEKNCAACHVLQFDDRFTQPIPHKTPDVVHAFVVQQFQDYISQHPEEIRNNPQPVNRRVPGMMILPSSTPKNANEWVQQRVDETEQLLWNVTCKLCHQLEFPTGAAANALPRVKPSVMPARWLPNAMFSHEAHSVVACESCHAQALASEKSSEVLIPGIKSCQSCHNGDPAHAGNAENRCFLCHTYHNWKQRVHFHSRFTIEELTGIKPLGSNSEAQSSGEK